MKYEEPKAIDRADAVGVLMGHDQSAIQEVLVGLAFTQPDWVWVQEQCLTQIRSDDWSTRAVAATCLGHIARIHRQLDLGRALPALHSLREDSKTRGYADDALADIEHYLESKGSDSFDI